MPANFAGDWTIEKHDDFTALLDKLEIAQDARPPANITKLEVSITQNGDEMTVKSTSFKGTREYSFTVGSTFETNLIDIMPKMTVTSSWDGDRLVFVNETGFKLIRELDGDKMITSICAHDMVVKVYFKRA